MNWQKIWMDVFGRLTFLGIDMGFWVSMGISLVVALAMNAVFWNMKPFEEPRRDD